MPLSNIDKIDNLYKYLYEKGSAFTPFRQIVDEHFLKDETNNDIQGMLIKLDKDGHVDTGTKQHTSVFETWEETIYKLSFEGRFLYENSLHNKPYLTLKKKKIERGFGRS